MSTRIKDGRLPECCAMQTCRNRRTFRRRLPICPRTISFQYMTLRVYLQLQSVCLSPVNCVLVSIQFALKTVYERTRKFCMISGAGPTAKFHRTKCVWALVSLNTKGYLSLLLCTKISSFAVDSSFFM